MILRMEVCQRKFLERPRTGRQKVCDETSQSLKFVEGRRALADEPEPRRSVSLV